LFVVPMFPSPRPSPLSPTPAFFEKKYEGGVGRNVAGGEVPAAVAYPEEDQDTVLSCSGEGRDRPINNAPKLWKGGREVPHNLC